MTQTTEPSTRTTAEGRPMVAVVTGASTGIGAATARRLRRDGWVVYAAARRAERLERLAEECGAIAAPTDLTDQRQVDALRDRVLAERGTVDALLNISGGARGLDPVAEARDEDWQFMYDVNVMGSMRLIRAFLPALRENGQGTVLSLTSIAGWRAYEGGAGYNAAKHAQRAMTEALRLEEVEHGLRVIEIAPGLVHTEEFSLRRLRGDQAAADRVYAGVDQPLTAEDVAEVCAFAVGLPHHVNLDSVTVKPVAQAAPHKLVRRA